MTIEEEIFARSTPNDAAFVPFGFVRGRDGSYRYSEQFLDKQFRADVCIKNGVITGRVFDIASDEEYMPLRVTRHHGAFVNEVRTAYSAVLRRIKEACFIQQPFLSAQANRIARAVNDAYGDAPDFTFPTAPTYAVFRNPQNKRWYGIVMNIARGKLTAKHDAKKSRSSNNGKKQPGGTRHAANTRGDTKAAAANATRAAKKSRNSERQTEGEKIVEILNVKLAPEKSAHLITQKGFFPPYHMNKKNWITIVLDGTVRDSVIMELLAESHAFTEKGSRALSGKKLLSAREAHTWIIPVKPDYYDVEQDFRRDGTIRWHQRVSACVGATSAASLQRTAYRATAAPK